MSLGLQRRQRLLVGRVASQGALLFTGFALAQACSFARNAALGYCLSRGDFGIAAALAVTLQLIETMSDIGADRLLVQAEDGDAPVMLAAAHAIALCRGAITAILLLLLAGPTAGFFRVDQHAGLFAALALVPLIKGFANLEQRCRQRHLDNRSHLAIEVGSQAVSLAFLPFLLWISATPSIVVWLALVQATVAVKLSHALATTSWRPSFAWQQVRRFLVFGWPIWLSAFPLMIIYQADRFLVGRTYGMEALAAYSAAFMVTMVPGLVAAKVGHALMLPLLSEMRANRQAFADRYRIMCETTVLFASVYLALFVIAGGKALALAFGPSYVGLDTVVAMLAVMWTLRMIQAPPGMALMAAGDNRPLLWAGLIRAASLPLAVAAALLGRGVEGIAAAGIVGELASLGYVAFALRGVDRDLTAVTLGRALMVLPMGAAALLVAHAMPAGGMSLQAALLCAVVALGATLAGVLIQPMLRRALWGRLFARVAVSTAR